MAEPSLKQQLRQAMNEARRGKDRDRARLFSTVLSDVRNREIELGRDLEDDDEAVIEVIGRAIKMRLEAAEQMSARPERAEQERREAELLGEFMPARLSEEEIRTLVEQAVDAGASELGAVMGRVMPQVKGRAEGREVNRIAREVLEEAGS